MKKRLCRFSKFFSYLQMTVLLLLTGFLCCMVKAETTAYYLKEEELWEIAISVGQQYQIDSAVLVALVDAESSRNIYAVNGNHYGLTQISSRWHQDRCKRLGITDLYDPYSNLMLCADYLSELLDISEQKGYGRSLEYALMRYNMATASADSCYESGQITAYAAGILEQAESYQEEKAEWEAVYLLEKNMEDLEARKQTAILAKKIGSPYLLESIEP